MNVIPLSGCTTEPLMSYLKALGVLRLVAEQADPSVAMTWHGGACRLRTELERDQLVEFFRDRYRPTPIVGPWGARSGFYAGTSESSAREALNRIVSGAESLPRLAPFRDVVAAIHGILRENGFTEKVRDDDKLALMRICRNELPDSVLPWLDAVFVLTDDSRKFPPLLGTGGNEGSGSYVSAFSQLVVSLLIDRDNDDGVIHALFGEFAPALEDIPVGHFHPGAIGGPNSSQGFAGGGGANPWDYLLAIEGTLMLAGSAARRMGSDTAGRAAFPFCVEALAVGYASESEVEAAGSTRAELWLPLWWRKPVTYSELLQLFSEGRVQLGRRQARNAIDFALAVNRLGISRGIDAFVRYLFVMRNGLSYVAAPVGRVTVTPRPNAKLLEDPNLTRWLDRFRIACRDKQKTPARYLSALRRIDEAVYRFSTASQAGRDGDSLLLSSVLRALGRAEQTLSGGLRFCEENDLWPLQDLGPAWLEQADEGSAEFRLAASLAGLQRQGVVGPFRVFLEPVELAGRSFAWPRDQNKTTVWSNRSLAANLGAVFRRWLLESLREPGPNGWLVSARPARLADVVAFLHGDVNDQKLAELIWGLSTLNWPSVESRTQRAEDTAVPFEFGVPRLLVEPWDIISERNTWRLARSDEPKAHPAIFQVLDSGHSDAIPLCVDQAARQLKSDGRLVVGLRNRGRSGRSLAVDSPIAADRLLGALLFPLSIHDLSAVANSVLYPPETESEE